MTKNVFLKDYFKEYCEKVEMTTEQLYSKSRKRDLVEKRMAIMYALRKSVGMTLHKIAESLDKNHATVIHAVKTIEDFIKVYPHIRRYCESAEEALLNHKENLVEYFKTPILSDIERNKQLVDILLDNNDKLKLKIKQLKKELDEKK
tara:strand:+ start:189 stop:629 length:441 start_codon:yes stop_codon:yes gene_type:complete